LKKRKDHPENHKNFLQVFNNKIKKSFLSFTIPDCRSHAGGLGDQWQPSRDAKVASQFCISSIQLEVSLLNI
jgi:hypothetical protein